VCARVYVRVCVCVESVSQYHL